MNFIEAAKHLNEGKKIRLKYWKTSYLEGKKQIMKHYTDLERYTGKYYAYWSLSTADILSEDWEVVE